MNKNGLYIPLEEYDKSIIASVTDKKGNIVYATEAFCKISGYSLEELIGKNHRMLKDFDMPKSLYKNLWSSIKSGKEWFGNIKNKNKDGQTYWVKTDIKPVFDNDKEITGYIAIRHDITKEMEMTTIDMKSLLDHLQSEEYKFIGILNVKQVNKKETTLMEDILFKEKIEQQLDIYENENIKIFKGILGKHVVLSKYKIKQDNRIVFKKMFKSLQEFQLNNFDKPLEFKIGLSEIYDFTSTESSLSAEIALEVCKKTNRNFFIFNEKNKEVQDILKNNVWKEKTKFLVNNKKIYPFYQAIYNIDTGKIDKYEVLARGKLGDEIISPFFFISHAEKMDLINEVTKMIIEKSFNHFKDNKYEFNLNITEKDLTNDFFIPFLKEQLNKYNLDPNRVTLELLENITFSKNGDKITEQLLELREIGFKLAIDDFGSDNSNFARLLDINCDILKIDAVFIKNIHKSEKNIKIVRSIVSMAKILGIKTVAEYVENKEIFDTIKKCGINYAQGYYIGKPEEDTK